jgi:hypothetical protein
MTRMGDDPREDFEDLFRGEDFVYDEGDHDCYYLTPIIDCESCRHHVGLPYDGLPETDEWGVRILEDSDRPLLPSEGWSEIFGCTRCGHVAAYSHNQVKMHLVPKRSRSRSHAGANVYRVEFPCANRDCRSRFSIHVCTGEYREGQRARDESNAVAALRTGLFDGQRLPCGHHYKTIPADFYRAEHVTSRMW